MNFEWKVETKRLLLEIPPWVWIYQESVRLPDGQTVDDFYTITIPEYVVVVGSDEDDNIVVERHYRHGAAAVTLALPSGYVDPGEQAEQAARRELREETGYEAKSWALLGRFVVDGNRGCGWANIFEAKGVERVGVPDGKDLASVEVRLISRQQMLATIMDGGVAELASVAALALASLRTTNSIRGGSQIGLED